MAASSGLEAWAAPSRFIALMQAMRLWVKTILAAMIACQVVRAPSDSFILLNLLDGCVFHGPDDPSCSDAMTCDQLDTGPLCDLIGTAGAMTLP